MKQQIYTCAICGAKGEKFNQKNGKNLCPKCERNAHMNPKFWNFNFMNVLNDKIERRA